MWKRCGFGVRWYLWVDGGWSRSSALQTRISWLKLSLMVRQFCGDTRPLACVIHWLMSQTYDVHDPR